MAVNRPASARALYKRASMLVFDEATGALDNVTEQTVMHAIVMTDDRYHSVKTMKILVAE